MSVNKAIIVGHVGGDPKVGVTPSGAKYAGFSVATTERGYTAKNGQQVPDQTTWHNVIAWRGLAEIIEKWVHKGSHLYVEGKMTNRKYTDKNGVERYAYEILADTIDLVGGSKPAAERQEPPERAVSGQAAAQPVASQVNNQQQEPENPFGDVTPVDDMPF